MFKTAEPALAAAERKDREDELKGFRSRFYFPADPGGANAGPNASAVADTSPERHSPADTNPEFRSPADTNPDTPVDPRHRLRHAIYFCGNSLGLQPRDTETFFHQELADWRELAIGGYWQARNPWMTYPQQLARPLARLAGCLEDEVTVMNALTVNLHLLLLTFYRPTPHRHKILIEAGAFPSDQYAVETQVKWHGHDPAEAIVEVGPRPGEWHIREEDIVAAIGEHAGSLALVLLGGINYYTGQLFDMATITAAAHEAGALAGFDLAHAIGNAPLRLHDWDADFAVWCSYKYLNGGPGAAGGAFVHERHIRDTRLERLGGWWGNDEMGRFKTDSQSLPSGRGPRPVSPAQPPTVPFDPGSGTSGRPGGFTPKPTVEGWSMSTAQVFNMVALKASLTLFEEAGFDRLCAKSTALTGYLAELLQSLPSDAFRIITPARRAAQLSLYFGDRAKPIQQALQQAGVVTDYRDPGVIRVSPAPLYNSFEDVYWFYLILRGLL
ncbi:MAG TPA: kynureninase [Puia sp.]|nr:kynureninase [Puia sp.]